MRGALAAMIACVSVSAHAATSGEEERFVINPLGGERF